MTPSRKTPHFRGERARVGFDDVKLQSYHRSFRETPAAIGGLLGLRFGLCGRPGCDCGQFVPAPGHPLGRLD